MVPGLDAGCAERRAAGQLRLEAHGVAPGDQSARDLSRETSGGKTWVGPGCNRQFVVYSSLGEGRYVLFWDNIEFLLHARFLARVVFSLGLGSPPYH